MQVLSLCLCPLIDLFVLCIEFGAGVLICAIPGHKARKQRAQGRWVPKQTKILGPMRQVLGGGPRLMWGQPKRPKGGIRVQDLEFAVQAPEGPWISALRKGRV